MRFGEKEWKDTLDQWIGAHEREVQAILASYQVPLLDANGNLIASPRANTTHVMPIEKINDAFDLMHKGESIRSVALFE